jgi:hypothetical protein
MSDFDIDMNDRNDDDAEYKEYNSDGDEFVDDYQYYEKDDMVTGYRQLEQIGHVDDDIFSVMLGTQIEGTGALAKIQERIQITQYDPLSKFQLDIQMLLSKYKDVLNEMQVSDMKRLISKIPFIAMKNSMLYFFGYYVNANGGATADKANGFILFNRKYRDIVENEGLPISAVLRYSDFINTLRLL